MQFFGDLTLDPNNSTIHIVDDDAHVCRSLVDLFESENMHAACYSSGDEFITHADLERAGCILLDIYMPGANGFEIQQHMADRKCLVPIVFMTGRGTVALSVQAMKSGADDFLLKPLNRDEVLSATGQAIRRNAERRLQATERKNTLFCIETLTPREREVMNFVVEGFLNKDIARELSVSEMMIKLHRSRMMKKMQAASVPELVRKAELLRKHFGHAT
ncbi:response regulator transcription factor [Agrobacterium radiobacter]|jgi:FixJ family two-component response regulator|uniref:response regulator transcription factor n=1 Tax=Agrobacterium radiobacter TaxID=362 RepID=UPI000DE00D87|nr:response regulator [Agrobacterium radiobacter]MBB4408688.1 FixJ family two-component response regulator [Agrobacterium radiobacter]MBB4454383.1 FixJ family two-component response regulator [Agrobacterium radiobacter]